MNRNKIAGVVLAGGQSSRMGQDKALLDYNGRSLLDHMIGVLENAGLQNIYVSGDVKGYNSIPDTSPHKGPAYAIQDVLATLIAYEGILFIPIDMPLLSSNMLRFLTDRDKSAYFENYPFPVFIKNKKNLKRRISSLKGLLKAMKIDGISLPQEFERCMSNANTPDEWKKVLSA